jgi:hypothetical protein
MRLISKSLLAALAMGAALAGAGTASAQQWGGQSWGGHGGGYGYSDSWRHPGPAGRNLVAATCSGQRGMQLENRLRFKLNRGRIDFRTARRIDRAIDRLQYREFHECREGDFRAARNIGREYNRIDRWIDREIDRFHGDDWRH